MNLEKRLALIHMLYPCDHCSLLDQLHLRGLVSDCYDLRHLEYDLWFLYYARNTFRSRVDTPTNRTGEAVVLLRVTVQALIDVAIAKPCDQGLWSRDVSPCSDKNMKCTRDAHSCVQDALKFLNDVSSDQEEFMGLAEGTVRDYLEAMKKQSPRWSSAFRCGAN